MVGSSGGKRLLAEQCSAARHFRTGKSRLRDRLSSTRGEFRAWNRNSRMRDSYRRASCWAPKKKRNRKNHEERRIYLPRLLFFLFQFCFFLFFHPTYLWRDLKSKFNVFTCSISLRFFSVDSLFVWIFGRGGHLVSYWKDCSIDKRFFLCCYMMSTGRWRCFWFPETWHHRLMNHFSTFF